MANRIKYKINIRSVKDLEAARKLYNYCIFKGAISSALDIATKLHSFGYEGWDKKIATLKLMHKI